LITIESIIGNKNTDPKLKERYEQMSKADNCEVIRISRFEAQRRRMRKTSDKGTDVALNLSPEYRLKHGDVLVLSENLMILVEVEPEKLLELTVKAESHLSNSDIVEISARVGHIIGNLHRPIKVDKNRIYFPIQADTESDMFKKLLQSVKEYIQIKETVMVFEPVEGTELHDH
jgi:urease accessory protein